MMTTTMYRTTIRLLGAATLALAAHGAGATVLVTFGAGSTVGTTSSTHSRGNTLARRNL